jgi:ATP-dependent helicase HrpA
MLYARYAASIDPLWLETCAPHLIRRHYGEPFFDEESGSVKASERVTFYGFILANNSGVHFGRINPVLAREVFIREALVNERLQTQLRFFRSNAQLRQNVRNAEAKLRRGGLRADEESIAAFYQQRLPGVVSIHELNRSIREHNGDTFLHMTSADVLAASLPDTLRDYPDTVTIGTVALPMLYRFVPGDAHDGASLVMPYAAQMYIDSAMLDWLVPGMRSEQVLWILKSLPKQIRVQLQPAAEYAQKIVLSLANNGDSLITAVCNACTQLFNIAISEEDRAAVVLPGYLTVHTLIAPARQKQRTPDTEDDEDTFSIEIPVVADSVINPWRAAFSAWGQRSCTSWTFGDIPEKVMLLESEQGVPLTAYPALSANDHNVDLVLYTSAEQAAQAHQQGVAKLLEQGLSEELAWFEEEVKAAGKDSLFTINLGGMEAIRKNLLRLSGELPVSADMAAVRTEKEFTALAQHAAKNVREAYRTLGTTLSAISAGITQCQRELRKKKLASGKTFARVTADLERTAVMYTSMLSSPDLSYDYFVNLPRYLTAFNHRIVKAYADPAKYLARIELLIPWENELTHMRKNVDPESSARGTVVRYAAMVEEYKISLFAQQEVKTLFPVSEKRLRELAGSVPM